MAAVGPLAPGAPLVTAQAGGCRVEYKAKKDNPLRLDHGFVDIPAALCNPMAAEAEVRARLAQQGWILLAIVAIHPQG